jgi:Pretoxin HINT domain
VNRKAGAQAQQNFAKDEAAVQQSTQQASTDVTGWLGEKLAGFTSLLDEALPNVISGLSAHVATSTAGMAGAAADATGAMGAVGSSAHQQLAAGHATASAGIGDASEHMSASLAKQAESTAAEVEAQAEQVAAAIEQQTQAAAAAIVSAPGQAAEVLAAETRADIVQAEAQVSPELARCQAQVASGIHQGATSAATGVSAEGQVVGAELQAGARGAAERMAQAGSSAKQIFHTSAGTVGQQLQDSAAQATAELGKAGAQLGQSANQVGPAARTEIAKHVNQASTDQQANLGRVQSEKQGAMSQVASGHASLKAEADAKNAASSEAGGQAFLDFLIPKSWKESIKNFFKSSFLRFVTGLVYGIVTALVGLVLCLAVVGIGFLVGGPLGAAFAAGFLIGFAIPFLVNNRIQSFKAVNGRSPGAGEKICLVLLGIADVTGVPQIVEGIYGWKAFEKHDGSGQLRPKLDWFDRGEMIGSGLVQVIALYFGLRGAKTAPKVEVKPPEVKLPEAPKVEPPKVEPKAEAPKVEPKPEEPKVEPKPEPKPEPPKVDEGPPPKGTDGNYDFTGRENKQLGRDCSEKPYAGEEPATAQERVKAAQQEVVNRLSDLKPCFVAGTPVLTPDGAFPIEQIEVGTRVLAMAPGATGSLRAYAVLAVYRGVTDALRHVTAGGQTITATRNHCFYVVGRGWVEAHRLGAGDLLLTPRGETVEVEAVVEERLAQDVATFNLQVAEVHTYFVGGATQVLVHNENPSFDRPLWWLFGKAKFRATDVDGVSMWQTNNKQDVEDMFKIRKNIESRPSSDPHKAYTAEELAAKGIKVETTPGGGPMAGRLQHGSARPIDAAEGDLAAEQIQRAVDGLNEAKAAESATPKSMGCK